VISGNLGKPPPSAARPPHPSTRSLRASRRSVSIRESAIRS